MSHGAMHFEFSWTPGDGGSGSTAQLCQQASTATHEAPFHVPELSLSGGSASFPRPVHLLVSGRRRIRSKSLDMHPGFSLPPRAFVL